MVSAVGRGFPIARGSTYVALEREDPEALTCCLSKRDSDMMSPVVHAEKKDEGHD